MDRLNHFRYVNGCRSLIANVSYNFVSFLSVQNSDSLAPALLLDSLLDPLGRREVLVVRTAAGSDNSLVRSESSDL